MSTIALSGDDTIIIQNRIFNDLADGDCVALTFPNDIANVQTGKNGNSIYGYNASGNQCEVMIRLVRGSADDKFLNNLLTQQQNNFAGTVLLIGEFIKQLGDGRSNISNDTYIMSGGVFTKKVEAKSNVLGDTEQSVSIYRIKCSLAQRVIT